MRKNIHILLSFFMVLVLAGCSTIQANQKSMYDDNAKISNQGDSYTFRDRIGSVEANTLALSFSGFYGKQSIWRIDADSDGSVDMDISVNIKTGKFKLCLVDSEKNVSVIAEGKGINKFTLPFLEGRNYLVLVGNNATGEVSVSLENITNAEVVAVSME